MPKKFFKRLTPSHDRLRGDKYLKVLGPILEDPFLLHLNRRSVSGGLALGVFIAFIPMPFQMLLAAFMAFKLRVNILLSIGGVWLSNPVTMPPLFYFCYKVGAWILGVPPEPIVFELSWAWLWAELSSIWQPFLLGCLIVGILSGLATFVGVRLLWRLHVINAWKMRKLRKQAQKDRASKK